MGSKLRGSRLESELDRARTEGNWSRVAELVKAAKSRQSGLPSHLAKLIEAEAEIELFLESQDVLTPRSSHSSGLKASEERLRAVLADNDAEAVYLEARLLLAKCAYVKAEGKTAIGLIDESGMEKATTAFRSLRALRLVAEAYAIKGLCLEQQWEESEREGDMMRRQRIVSSFEKAAELTISYVGELEKTLNPMRGGGGGMMGGGTLGTSLVVSSANTSLNVTVGGGGGSTTGSLQRGTRGLGGGHERIGDILEYCLERVAKLRLRETGMERRVADEGVEWYRHIMTSLGDKSTGERLQMRLSRQFAELLLRAIPDAPQSTTSKALSSKSQSLGFYSGGQKAYFCPRSRQEEIILLLLLSESLCTKDIVLGRTDDVPPWQAQAVGTAKAVYNLLTLMFTTLRQFYSLSSVFERAMKFANDDPFLWQQFALSSVSRGASSPSSSFRALRVLERSLAVAHASPVAEAPQTAAQHLVAAQLYIENGDYDKGVEHADAASLLAGAGVLKGRALLLRAVSLQQKACTSSRSFYERLQFLSESGHQLEKCIELDAHDYLTLYYAALHYAHVRDLSAARERLGRSLELHCEQPHALLLLALIFTAENDYKAAMEIVKKALDDFPSHYALRVLQLHLFIKIGRVGESMEASKHLLDLFSSRNAGGGYGSRGGTGAGVDTVIDSASSVHRAGSRWGRDNSTVYSAPLGGGGGSQNGFDVSDSGVFAASASEMGGASTHSEVSTGMGGAGGVAAGVARRYRAQASIWVSLAELFLDEGRLSDVQPCIEQAVQLFPNSAHALYLKGRLMAAKGATMSAANGASRVRAEARGAFLSALSLAPEYINALVHLASLSKEDGQMEMAEHCLKELVRVDPLDGRWWNDLGELLLARGRETEAISCLASAAQLGKMQPLLPFTAIPLVFPSCQ
uniref:Tetratricopeptide repeat protein 7 N-terminal domain-containing protein n=1 Tax=Pristionchus pacificus TaxID=54126 RepID=A0A8R1Z4T3_PRIPA